MHQDHQKLNPSAHQCIQNVHEALSKISEHQSRSISARAIMDFFEQARDQGKSYDGVFMDRYGVSIDHLDCVDCRDDNQEFWDVFQNDLRAQNSDERHILAFANFVIVAELQTPRLKSEKEQDYEDRVNEDKKMLHIFSSFYNSEIMHEEGTLPETSESLRINDQDKRQKVIEDTMSLYRGFAMIRRQFFIPSVFMEVGHFIRQINHFIGDKSLSNTMFRQSASPRQTQSQSPEIKNNVTSLCAARIARSAANRP